MAEFPAFPLFTDAYLGDTTHLTTFEHGAYLLLLIVSWRSKDGILPDDDAMLARYTRTSFDKWRKLRPILAPFFQICDGQWSQARLQDELQHLRSRKLQQSEAGRASVQSKSLKRLNRQSTHVDPSLQRNVNETSTPTPTPTPIKEDVTNVTSKKGRVRGERLSNDWSPTRALPQAVFDLATQWPPDRLDRELDGFRDYWTSRTTDAARCDWDKVWHNRIRDQHDRVMRETRNGTANRNGNSAGRATKPDGFMSALRQVADAGTDGL